MAALLKSGTATEASFDCASDPLKWQRVLCSLMTESLNRFDAEKLYDHCLHSTVCKIRDMGIRVDRQWESVPCRGGRNTTRVKRYWVEREGENLKRAQALVDSFSSGR